ncbi:MAG: NUDIX domain-containing protein [Caldilinea sp. CFX5]|nr:NUDIX domain-containing protein [Caldilinea sp. CFX5]
MPTRGAQVVIFNPDCSQTLLIKREDIRVWTVPGGRIEADETAEAAAQREALEETGFTVAIDQYLGEYWRPQLPNGGALVYAYVGYVVSGDSKEHSWEAVAVEWFAVDQLPKRTLSFARAIIDDTRFATELPVKRTQLLAKWQAIGFLLGVPIRNLRNRLRGR